MDFILFFFSPILFTCLVATRDASMFPEIVVTSNSRSFFSSPVVFFFSWNNFFITEPVKV